MKQSFLNLLLSLFFAFASLGLLAVAVYLVWQTPRAARVQTATNAMSVSNLPTPQATAGLTIVTATPTAVPLPATNTPAPTPIVTATATVSATATPPPTPTHTPTLPPPTAPAIPATLNGLPLDQILVMPPNVQANVQNIVAQGQAQGRNPRAFSIVGDSTVEQPHFLTRFDEGPYNLAAYAYLQRTIDHFRGSFGRDSAAVRIGLHSWTAFDPLWADKAQCAANEASVPCEIRLHNPAVIIIRLGSNDVGVPQLYEDSMREIIEYALASGIVPVLGTKADRHEGSNQNNDILRRLAGEYQIPLWEYDVVAGTIPGRGLDSDGVHMTTFYAHDYTQPQAFNRGHAVHNLAALIMLDQLREQVLP